MHKKIIFVIIVAISISFKSFSYDCKKYDLNDARKINYHLSDFICLGLVTSNENEKIYSVFVMYIFKGEAAFFRMFYINAIPRIRPGDIVLLYSNYDEESRFYVVDECSISRSLRNPQIPFYHTPNYFNLNTDCEINSSNELKLVYQKAKIDFYEEIINLYLCRIHSEYFPIFDSF